MTRFLFAVQDKGHPRCIVFVLIMIYSENGMVNGHVVCVDYYLAAASVFWLVKKIQVTLG